eukprot:SAG11_NODE_21435_length_425_cov_0.766871_1_plen_52_part_10
MKQQYASLVEKEALRGAALAEAEAEHERIVSAMRVAHEERLRASSASEMALA